ncbi:hypothetical protein HV824_07005 [Myxococcus sp. AM009]|uniref:ELWxxDGT repeat protein n=1 Tax=unclassified Myxococcus TaxID=2648731 RepID=UPI001595465B|nr:MULTISPECIES: ELWxxDGT repeat protein [unclassified Myxococcus]NVI97869.1 hypothetical protein [Myxococcus sp. AM009]NVJ15449.1 hypothetical protein [Myxococcus sp. AM010]
MRALRGVVLSCAMVVGCGASPPDEAPFTGEPIMEELSLPDSGEGALAAQWARPTPGRARLVEDIFPGEQPWTVSPYPESRVSFRGKLYFAVNFDEGPKELWRSDGSRAGTDDVESFPALRPDGSTNLLFGLTPVGNRLFFVVGDSDHGTELWVSDGTRGGTRLVEDLTPGPASSRLENLTAVGKTLFFFRRLPETPETPGRTELWTSDGTARGTVRVRDFGPGSSVGFQVAVVDDLLFFPLADPQHGNELWRSDGSRSGTKLLKDISPGPTSSNPRELRAAGDFVYFVATDPDHGEELWMTNGSRSCTELVKDLERGPVSSFPTILQEARGSLFFTTYDASSSTLALYRVKVGDDDPKRIRTIPNPYAGMPDAEPYITASATTGQQVFLTVAFTSTGPAPRDVQLWVSDGTGSGTKLLYRPLSLSDEFITELFAVEGLVFFPANGEGTGTELFVTDGTVRGTRLLQDIAPGAVSSSPFGFTRVGERVFFVAFHPDSGTELWDLTLQDSCGFKGNHDVSACYQEAKALTEAELQPSEVLLR